MNFNDINITEEKNGDKTYNILMIVADQLSYQLLKADDYCLPAREKLMKKGITFENHYISSAVCTPSRGTIFTGQHPQVSGIFDHMILGYVPSLDPDKPSIGTTMKKLGYNTAYYGKFELDSNILYPDKGKSYRDALKKYGFDEFQIEGDRWGSAHEGYVTDICTTAEGIRWLRKNNVNSAEKNKPWFMTLSFLNPHDIMYADCNKPGESVQVNKSGEKLAPPPKSEHYSKKWNFDLWESLNQDMDAQNLPSYYKEYFKIWGDSMGYIPKDNTDMWKTYYNYYLNLVKENDNNLNKILNELDNLDLWKNTIVVFTSDHGELAGAHGGLRSKGPFSYEQNSHVPFIAVHPDAEGGRVSKELTCHIDILPTLAGLTDRNKETIDELNSSLPGNDFSAIIKDQVKSENLKKREGVLFNYVSPHSIDYDYFNWVFKYPLKGEFPPDFSVRKPNLSYRGFMSFVYDGRYKFARFYSPDNFNTPATFEEIFQNNDIELYDLKNDPDEMNNLAAESEKYRDLIMSNNTLMNKLIAEEVGKNDGSYLPHELWGS